MTVLVGSCCVNGLFLVGMSNACSLQHTLIHLLRVDTNIIVVIVIITLGVMISGSPIMCLLFHFKMLRVSKTVKILYYS